MKQDDRTTQAALNALNISKSIIGDTELLCYRRHLSDLEKSKQGDYQWTFDIGKANRLIEYAETLHIAEGTDNSVIGLADFQAFIFGNLNGWVHKKTGFRRFRESYVQIARQQGKSMMNGILTSFYSNFTKYKFPQVYCAAPKRKQARIVFEEVSKFILADPDLAEFFEVKDYANTIKCKLTKGEIYALGRDTTTLDGFRPYFASVDEYHSHSTNQIYKLLSDGAKDLDECLISVITTAGFNPNYPCYEDYKYYKSVLKGAMENDRQFIFIAEPDEGDDYFDFNTLLKANPYWRHKNKGSENIVSTIQKAKEIGGDEQKNYITKQCNVWYFVGENIYIDPKEIPKCFCKKTLEDFRGKKCYAGLDLSSGGDLTTIALVFPYDNDQGTKKYFIYTHSFIPKNRLQEHIKSDKAPYDMWVRDGLITVTETLSGIKTDYKYIIKHLNDLVSGYDLKVQCVAYDPYNSSAFLNDIEDTGIDSISITQSARNLSEPTEDFRLEVIAGNVEFNEKEKLLVWSIVNANVVSNSFSEIKIDKENKSSTKRIDPVDAVIDAWKPAMVETEPYSPVIEVTEDTLRELGW